MEDRLLLDKIDYEKGEIKIDGKIYPLEDKNFPTIQQKNPFRLNIQGLKLEKHYLRIMPM